MANHNWQRLRKSPIFQQNVHVDLHHGQFSNIEPELCISLLRTPSLKNFSALHPKLSKCSTAWMIEFLTLGGLDVLMNALEILSVRMTASNSHVAFMDAFVAIECVQCIKEVLNSQAGVQHFLSSPDLVCQLVYGKKCFLICKRHLLWFWRDYSGPCFKNNCREIASRNLIFSSFVPFYFSSPLSMHPWQGQACCFFDFFKQCFFYIVLIVVFSCSIVYRWPRGICYV